MFSFQKKGKEAMRTRTENAMKLKTEKKRMACQNWQPEVFYFSKTGK